MKEKQKQHTKTRNIEYTKFELQEYMKDKNMSNSMVTTLFALRSSMVRGVRGNFVSSSVRTQCPLQCRDTAEDTQRHLLECPILLSRLTVKEEMERDFVKYDDIFGGVQQQHQAVSTLVRLLELREEVLEERSSLPAANTGPSLHCPNVNYGNI